MSAFHFRGVRSSSRPSCGGGCLTNSWQPSRRKEVCRPRATEGCPRAKSPRKGQVVFLGVLSSLYASAHHSGSTIMDMRMLCKRGLEVGVLEGTHVGWGPLPHDPVRGYVETCRGASCFTPCVFCTLQLYQYLQACGSPTAWQLHSKQSLSHYAGLRVGHLPWLAHGHAFG